MHGSKTRHNSTAEVPTVVYQTNWKLCRAQPAQVPLLQSAIVDADNSGFAGHGSYGYVYKVCLRSLETDADLAQGLRRVSETALPSAAVLDSTVSLNRDNNGSSRLHTLIVKQSRDAKNATETELSNATDAFCALYASFDPHWKRTPTDVFATCDIMAVTCSHMDLQQLFTVHTSDWHCVPCPRSCTLIRGSSLFSAVMHSSNGLTTKPVNEPGPCLALEYIAPFVYQNKGRKHSIPDLQSFFNLCNASFHRTTECTFRERMEAVQGHFYKAHVAIDMIVTQQFLRIALSDVLHACHTFDVCGYRHTDMKFDNIRISQFSGSRCRSYRLFQGSEDDSGATIHMSRPLRQPFRVVPIDYGASVATCAPMCAVAEASEANRYLHQSFFTRYPVTSWRADYVYFTTQIVRSMLDMLVGTYGLTYWLRRCMVHLKDVGTSLAHANLCTRCQTSWEALCVSWISGMGPNEYLQTPLHHTSYTWCMLTDKMSSVHFCELKTPAQRIAFYRLGLINLGYNYAYLRDAQKDAWKLTCLLQIAEESQVYDCWEMSVIDILKKVAGNVQASKALSVHTHGAVVFGMQRSFWQTHMESLDLNTDCMLICDLLEQVVSVCCNAPHACPLLLLFELGLAKHGTGDTNPLIDHELLFKMFQSGDTTDFCNRAASLFGTASFVSDPEALQTSEIKLTDFVEVLLVHQCVAQLKEQRENLPCRWMHTVLNEGCVAEMCLLQALDIQGEKFSANQDPLSLLRSRDPCAISSFSRTHGLTSYRGRVSPQMLWYLSDDLTGHAPDIPPMVSENSYVVMLKSAKRGLDAVQHGLQTKKEFGNAMYAPLRHLAKTGVFQFSAGPDVSNSKSFPHLESMIRTLVKCSKDQLQLITHRVQEFLKELPTLHDSTVVQLFLDWHETFNLEQHHELITIQRPLSPIAAYPVTYARILRLVWAKDVYGYPDCGEAPVHVFYNAFSGSCNFLSTSWKPDLLWRHRFKRACEWLTNIRVMHVVHVLDTWSARDQKNVRTAHLECGPVNCRLGKRQSMVCVAQKDSEIAVQCFDQEKNLSDSCGEHLFTLDTSTSHGKVTQWVASPLAWIATKETTTPSGDGCPSNAQSRFGLVMDTIENFCFNSAMATQSSTSLYCFVYLAVAGEKQSRIVWTQHGSVALPDSSIHSYSNELVLFAAVYVVELWERLMVITQNIVLDIKARPEDIEFLKACAHVFLTKPLQLLHIVCGSCGSAGLDSAVFETRLFQLCGIALPSLVSKDLLLFLRNEGSCIIKSFHHNWVSCPKRCEEYLSCYTRMWKGRLKQLQPFQIDPCYLPPCAWMPVVKQRALYTNAVHRVHLDALFAKNTSRLLVLFGKQKPKISTKRKLRMLQEAQEAVQNLVEQSLMALEGMYTQAYMDDIRVRMKMLTSHTVIQNCIDFVECFSDIV